MPLPKIKEVRQLSDTELAENIIAVKRELFELRLLKGTGRLEKTHQFKHKRHRLAQLLTLETERQKAAEQESSAKSTTTQESPASTAPEEE
ncbi:MAG: 50S ribosomal protein L29 [Oscillatoria sp. PMC 1051.18]|nr:50S ribosomal protein L29 [Oscillatoria sp. PMC 1050.18]MEC5029210.1 50S ribosomal protein L29 [Oscillatoria sp. PMC 1051.18]